MVRHTLIDMNSAGLKYYPFMISLNKCTGSCNAFSPKVWVPKETKDISVKAFNKITNKNKSTATTNHVSCDCKCKFNSTTWNQIKNKIIKHFNMNVNIITHAKMIIFGILTHVFVRTESIWKVLLVLQSSSVMKL